MVRSASGSRVAAVIAMLVATAAAAAVDTGAFELDGNALQDAVAPPEDWATLYDGGANTGGSSTAFTGVIPDPGQDTIFAGGRKDIQDITQWKWKNNGGFPDKNDITNAYAAAYLDAATDDLIVYFGADRYSNTGDAFLGFWFFKSEVTLNPNGTFNGQHEIGDILVLVNYPQGANAMPEIQVIEWNPALQDIGTNLHLLFSGVGAVCGAVPPDDDACAITNSGPTASPWPYVPKSGPAGTFPLESFFEGGINLTQILGGTACFSSFLAETRSSTSITATLKDFVLGAFPVCEIDVEKQCTVVSLADEDDPTDKLFQVDFSGAVTNTGGGTFPAGETVTVVDNAGTPGDESDDEVIELILAAPFAPGDMIIFDGTFYSDDNPPMNTITASVTFGGVATASDDFNTDCGALPLNPALQLSKMCSTVLETVDGMLVVRVEFTGEVENTGDVPLLVTVNDDPAGNVLPATLIGPGESVPLSGSYYPSQANGGETDPTAAMFTDTLMAVGLNPALPEPVVEMISATCPLCP